MYESEAKINGLRKYTLSTVKSQEGREWKEDLWPGKQSFLNLQMELPPYMFTTSLESQINGPYSGDSDSMKL